MTDAPFITRFAPSPTGLLHLGHAYAAQQVWDAAREAGGTCLLRIEDIDTTRCKPEFEQAILEDLAWLGLTWPNPVRRQSDHRAAYAQSLDRLKALGVVYPCVKTRAEIAAESDPETGLYRGPGAIPDPSEADAMERAAGRAAAWRLSMRRAREILGARWDRLTWLEDGAGPRGETGPRSAAHDAAPRRANPQWLKSFITTRPDLFGDAVIARRDIGVSYMLAVVHDDALQGVTHVVRGRDLYDSTPVQVILQALLDLPTPLYRHHRLLL